MTEAGIEATLAALSPYALRQVAPLDPQTGKVGHSALISFGIRAQTLGRTAAAARPRPAAIGTGIGRARPPGSRSASPACR